jgi:2-dehydro-3-deoxygluconokinase
MTVFCFGELLLRLSPELNGAWIRHNSMPVYIGGAELNVASALACWKIPVRYGTALPDHYLSREICSSLEAKGIQTSAILFSGERIGAYYLPQGADLKNAGVIYDRAHSSFSKLHTGQIDWDAVLTGVDWFHFSAISPALNEAVAAVCKEALEAASAKGLPISVDLNYRSKLWQWGRQPWEVMPGLVQHCDVVMGNIWAAETMLQIPVAVDLVREKASLLQEAQRTSEAIVKRFPKCRQVANTFRFHEAGAVRYYATLHSDGQLFVSPEQRTETIVDKVGSGDTFMAGLIYGFLKKLGLQDTINFAAAAAFNKLFIKGDSTTATVEAIQNSANGNG